MNPKKSLRKTLMNILFYVVTIFLFAYILLNVVAPNKVLDVFQFKVSTVVSKSMQGTINKGDLVVEIKPADVEVGDIIIFYNYLYDYTTSAYYKEEVIHRVVSIDSVDGETIYVTKGDNDVTNPTTDIIIESLDSNGDPIYGYTTADDILAVYAFRIPYLGWVPLSIQVGMSKIHVDPIFLGLILINGIVIYALVKVLRKKPEDEEDKGDQDDVE